MKYIFDVKEVSYGRIEVEATNIEEARNKAENEYHSGNTFWASGEHEMELETAVSVNGDRCVCCGILIPEGRQVCPNCEKR